jgi:hypothetical protein
MLSATVEAINHKYDVLISPTPCEKYQRPPPPPRAPRERGANCWKRAGGSRNSAEFAKAAQEKGQMRAGGPCNHLDVKRRQIGANVIERRQVKRLCGQATQRATCSLLAVARCADLPATELVGAERQ